MAGIVGQYNIVPRIRTITTPDIILSDGVNNPVDISPVTLSNIRGQLTISGVASDSLVVWSLQVTGGFGEYPGVFTRDFYFIPGSNNVNATVTEPMINTIRVTTPVADAGGRVYEFQFFPSTSTAPTVRQTSVNTLGVADLTVTITKQMLVEHF